MFDPSTKQAWQGIEPAPDLKARALKQAPKKIVRFPGRSLTKALSAVAACLIFGVVLLRSGSPDLLANGQKVSEPITLQVPAAISREVAYAALDAGITILLESEGALEVSGGTLTESDQGTLWTVDEPGTYTLQNEKNGRSRLYTLTFSESTGLWTLTPGK